MAEMKPILVHLHMFYAEMWPELKECLKNVLPYPHEIFVTAVEPLPEIEKDAKSLSNHVYFDVVENRGFDVGPFIWLLNKVNLDDYSYIIKLHSKRDVPQGTTLGKCCDISLGKWRKYLLKFMSNLSQCLQSFENDATLGMISDYRLVIKDRKDNPLIVKENEKLLRQLKLPTENFAYVAGTMFITRAKLFIPLKNLHLGIKDFEISRRKTTDKLPYALEMLFGNIIVAQGFAIKDPLVPQWKQRISPVCDYIKNFIYRKKVNGNKTTIKIFKIQVFRKITIDLNERTGGRNHA